MALIRGDKSTIGPMVPSQQDQGTTAISANQAKLEERSMSVISNVSMSDLSDFKAESSRFNLKIKELQNNNISAASKKSFQTIVNGTKFQIHQQ